MVKLILFVAEKVHVCVCMCKSVNRGIMLMVSSLQLNTMHKYQCT